MLSKDKIVFSEYKEELKKWLDDNWNDLVQIEFDSAPKRTEGEENILLRFNAGLADR